MNENKGALTEAVFYILISLYTPLHGYGVIQNAEKLSGGRVKLGAGTLYGALKTLLVHGWIEEYKVLDDRKREYIITDSGKRAVRDELVRLEELLGNGKKVLKENGEPFN